MWRKSPNLSLTLPRCRNCNRHWRPAQGVVADAAYCKKCTEERQAVATSKLGLNQITVTDLTEHYLLQRRFRSS